MPGPDSSLRIMTSLEPEPVGGCNGASSGDFFRSFAENSPDPVFVCDASERLVWFNPELERITGYSAGELTSLRVSDLVSPESRRRAAAAIRHRLTAPHRMRHEIQILSKGNVPIDLDIFSWLVLRDGQPAWIQAVARDVTDAKRRERQAHRAERTQLLNLLAGGVAHDFNNLLMAIYAYADQLKCETEGCASLRQAADVIQRTAERGIEISNRLLKSATDAKPSVSALDLHATLSDLVGLLRQTVGSGIQVSAELGAASSIVLADSAQMYQLFLNLAMNARDAMPAGGEIVFRTRIILEPCGEMLAVDVKDTGTGIPPEILGRIFEPFFTTKDPEKGTGIGLALVHGIVKYHRGRISVESEASGGTTFHVLLPLCRRARAATAG
ncbi:MAG: ATP-binding protein [Acidobacteria bacterium]|nr:ATP-binding protein [Acidobacteriota bacterium]